MKQIIVTLLILFSVFSVSAADDLHFELGLSGLPAQNESNMVRDHEGLLWFHSYGSLCSYDGYEV